MTVSSTPTTSQYGIRITPVDSTVTAWRGETVLARSDRARVMHETRLAPAIYFPREDVIADLRDTSDLQTFCPFKGTASYMDLHLDGERIGNAAWTYADALPESTAIEGYVAFMPGVVTRQDTGSLEIEASDDGHISGPIVDWILRGAAECRTPESLTARFAEKLIENGVSISRVSVMIWSLHPMIAGKNYVWKKETGAVDTFAPSYEIHDSPGFINSPLRHVSSGLGGIRQKLGYDYAGNSFPILQDLKSKGATDYVAMPLRFSDGQINVLTLTCDHPDGFTTANLGLIFECSAVIGRYYEVFNQAENARALLETYVGKRTGARVLGGEIRRGDGDEIDATIMFCDLRGSTRLEEELGRKRYIDLLNFFFETTSSIIEKNGGEVLKFIGDAVLAVFPADQDPDLAKQLALGSAREIVGKLGSEGDAPGQCDCAIGLAFGRVTYGNVGSSERLDFTVIGKAANVAARLGDYGKSGDHRIVVSQDLIADVSDAIDLGAVSLRNVSGEVRCYAVAPMNTASPGA